MPVAGPDSTQWVQNQIAYVRNLGDRVSAVSQYYIDNPPYSSVYGAYATLMTYLAVSSTLDWQIVANSQCNALGPDSTWTVSDVVVSEPKLANMLWAHYTRCVFTDATPIDEFVELLLSWGFVGTPDSLATKTCYEAGEKLYAGLELSYVMELLGHQMQEPGGLASRLWPSEALGPGMVRYPPTGARFQDSFLTMTTAQLIEYAKALMPGF